MVSDISMGDKKCLTVTSSEEITDESLRLYPNPVDDMLYVEGVDLSIVTIYNSFGRTVNCQINKQTIDVSSLDKGVYFVSLPNGKKLKFIKI